jgi:cytochrome c553
MYGHYSQVREIQTAVIAGDVAATREPARWLTRQSDREYPEGADAALEAMRAEARSVLAHDDIPEIARAVSRMVTACGSCHVSSGGGPHIQVGEAPPAATHMQRDQWALDRLWEGLAGPSDAAWAAGSEMLMDALVPTAAPGADAAQAAQLGQRVRELGGVGRQARSAEERTTVYGQVLQTCANCHQALGMRGH